MKKAGTGRWRGATAALVLLAAGSAAAAVQFEGAVAWVGGVEIMAAAVRAERDRTDVKHGSFGLSPREKNMRALEQAVRRELVFLDVKKRKLLEGPLGDTLRAVTVPAYARIWRQAREREIAVTDAEIDAEAPGVFSDQRRVSYIVTTDEEPIRAARARALAGEDFAALAREYSEGPASEIGGDLGWLGRGENKYFTDAQWAAIFRLPKGGVTEVFPGMLFEDSYVIARVEDVRSYSAHEVAEMRNSVRGVLAVKKVDAEVERLVRDSRLALQEKALPGFAKAERAAVLATFDGGTVTAGLFRAYVERMEIVPASMDDATMRSHLMGLGELSVIAAKKKAELESREGFKERVEKGTKEALLRAYLKQLYESVTVSDREVERAYDESPDKSLLPAQVELWQIRFASRAEADEGYARLLRGEEFESVAQIFSQTPGERKAAGLVGLVKEDDYPEPLRSQIFGLGLMKVSRPVETRFGHFIFQVRSKVPARKLSLDDVRQRIHKELLEAKQAQAYVETMARLKREFGVKVDDAALDKI